MKTTLILAASLGLQTVLCPVTASAGDRDSDTAKGRTILLVDDHEVLYRSGTERVSHPARRFSDKAIIAADKPWDRLIGYTSVYRNPHTGKYQLWYQAYSGARSGDLKLKSVVAYAESNDGITFTKPELDLFPFLGMPSNIVLDSNAGFGDRYGAGVCRQLEDVDRRPGRFGSVEERHRADAEQRFYAKQDATPLAGDSLRHKVVWKERRLKDLPPGEYTLRVHLDNATLYAIDFK